MACALESNVHGKGVGQREEPTAQRPQSIPGEALDLQISLARPLYSSIDCYWSPREEV